MPRAFPARVPHNGRMAFDVRTLAIATAGFCAFVNLYSVQALLPALARDFGVGAGEISWLMTAGTAAIALTAPFTGALADVLGRKRLIAAAMFAIAVPTLLMTLVHERAGVRVLALRPGPAAAADLHRRGRLYRRRMAGGRRAARRRHLHFRRQHRRLFRPLHSRRADRSGRLAARFRRGGADHARRRDHRRRDAAARAAASCAPAGSRRRLRRCCATCASRSWWRLTPSASACCSISSPPSPM